MSSKSLAFKIPSLANTTTSGREYARYTLLASYAYRENAIEAAEELDAEGRDCMKQIWGSFEENMALKAYAEAYALWRDSDFSMTVLVSILDYIFNYR